MTRTEQSRAIQAANESWNDDRERALYDTESFLTPMIEAIETMEKSDAGKHVAVRNIIAQMDAFIAYERSEKRIAEKIAAKDRFDEEWHNKFWYGHKGGLFEFFSELHQKHELQ